MPAISKIRLANVIFEEGMKRYNDELFLFDGYNGAILLENGGGKTVLIQTALQAAIPHTELAGRKIGKTLTLESSPAHIAVEWIINEKPRRYLVTAVTLFTDKKGVDSYRYVYEYQHGDAHGIEEIPFVRDIQDGKRPAERGEMQDYYTMMKDKSLSANTFSTISDYRQYLEEHYQIIGKEWESIVKINSSEGGVEAFFDACKTTNQLFDRLLIPTVENAIVGHDEHLFASLFEQRYTSFKNYKKLKETIEENKKIQDELATYATAFERLHEKEQQFLRAKQRIKGVWEYTENQQQSYAAEKETLEEKEKIWQDDIHKHQVNLSSFHISERREEQEQAESEYEKASLQLQEQETKTKEIQGQRAALRYAKFTKEQKEAEDSLAFFEIQIASMEEQTEIEEINHLLFETEQALHGAYQQQLEGIEKAVTGVQRERNPLLDQAEALKIQLNEYQGQEKQLNEEIIKLNSFIENRVSDNEKLSQSLLANPEQETVEEILSEWEARYQYLDDEWVALVTKIKDIRRQIQEKQQEKEGLQKLYQDETVHYHRVKQQIHGMHDDEKQLIVTLSMLRSAWRDIDSIHLRQQSIQGQLENYLEKQYIEREKLLSKERIALRYVDDYKKQDTFFSDPFLADQIESWKNQLDLLESGVDYLAQLPEEVQQKLGPEKLWSAMLVTTTKSKPRLLARLAQVADRLTFPVLVVSTEEAMDRSAVNHKDWIAPSHWQQNQQTEHFTEWKSRLKHAAEEMTETREGTEGEIKKWEQALEALRYFLNKYPYEHFAEWQETLHKVETDREKSKASIKQATETLEKMDQLEEQYIKLREETGEERTGLEGKLRDARQYVKYQKEIKAYQLLKEERNSNREAAAAKVKQTTRSIKRYEEDIEEKNERIRNLQMEIDKLREQPTYQEVALRPVVFTDESIRTLLQKRRELQFQRESITRQAGEWQAKKQAERERIKVLQERMLEEEEAFPQIDKSQTFPADGEQYIQQLSSQLQTARDHLKNTREAYQNARETSGVKKALLLEAEKEFRSRFPEDTIHLFSADLAVIKQQLQTEEMELKKRKTYLDQEISRVHKEFSHLEEAMRQLEKFIEGYHFNAPDIVSSSLSEQERMDFQYNSQQIAKAATDDLREMKKLADEEKKRVTAAKDDFRIFCRNQITDRKLQQMAVQGVEQKRTYDEVITFKQNMFASIQRITKYANEHIRKSDEELQLFINQIHTHLETLVEELDQIPKRTSVKVENWKQIYTFSIPKWESEDGKLRIRNHTEWIIKQLENDKYLNDLGQQDAAKIRNDLEKWLGSKQLLKIVMDREVMKVHCRKVTNDNEISGRSYSWEQSNVWSGGEKWSKNMTLFLGILKYVAEKKKTNLTNRTVILDNPFGKASSDHVLSPVFFIADQLGFQIIALTAHAEGKFLQDYFPVIYSCRLRASNDRYKKVMTTEKWLHHAYFQDHEPAAIDRLGQTEQLGLFTE